MLDLIGAYVTAEDVLLPEAFCQFISTNEVFSMLKLSSCVSCADNVYLHFKSQSRLRCWRMETLLSPNTYKFNR